MEYLQPPAIGFHASPPPSVPPRPPVPPAVVFPAAAPTPSTAGVKRKRQGNHVVHGAVPAAAAPHSSSVLPPISGAGSRTGASSTPSGGRPKSQAKGPRKKAVVARGRAPPPPNPAAHVPRDPVNSTGVHNVFEETPESYNVHTSYAELLEKNEVNLMSAPLDAFEVKGMEAGVEAEVEEGGDGYDDVEELEEEEFDASQEKFGKRTDNYAEMEDLCLVRAWESVSLDAVAGKDQPGKKYWQRIVDKYHKLMPIPSGH